MPVSLDLRKAHKVRRHGDLLAIYTWVNDERALVLLPALISITIQGSYFRFGALMLQRVY